MNPINVIKNLWIGNLLVWKIFSSSFLVCFHFSELETHIVWITDILNFHLKHFKNLKCSSQAKDHLLKSPSIQGGGWGRPPVRDVLNPVLRRCIATARIFIEVQNQLNPFISPTTSLRKLFQTLWKTPKQHLWGGGWFWKILFVKKSYNSSFERSLHPYHFG